MLVRRLERKKNCWRNTLFSIDGIGMDSARDGMMGWCVLGHVREFEPMIGPAYNYYKKQNSSEGDC